MTPMPTRSRLTKHALFCTLVAVFASGVGCGEERAELPAPQDTAQTSSALGCVTCRNPPPIHDVWTNRGPILTCSFLSGNNLCYVKGMPLIKQDGTDTDPLDWDVSPFGGEACANASHTMIMSAAWANRTTTARPDGRSGNFVDLPPQNMNGRGSFVVRENAKNNLEWYSHWGVSAPSDGYPAYSMQNLLYDMDPGSSLLWPDGCGINNWWSCGVYNNFGLTYWDEIDGSSVSWFNSAFLQSQQDNGYVAMISFYWPTTTTTWSGGRPVITYELQNPHKVAVNGYYRGQSYDLNINDPGSGNMVRARIGTKTPNSVEVLPGGAASWPTLEFEGGTGVNLITEIDYVWMK